MNFCVNATIVYNATKCIEVKASSTTIASGVTIHDLLYR